MERADNASSRMMTGIKGMIASLAAGFTVKFVVEQTDLYANNQARLGLINDGLQTQAELQQKIYAAASVPGASTTRWWTVSPSWGCWPVMRLAATMK